MSYLCLALLAAGSAPAQAKPPIYLWFEPEWFDGVQGSFAYWTGKAQPTGAWGIAGPGISAEWSQGGESEWNSMGVPAEETKASCRRDFVVPRAGTYKVWVRYVDHRHKTEPFRVTLEQAGKKVLDGELGIEPVVPPNDEFQLWWGFSFGWGVLQAKLDAGPAQLRLSIDKPGEAWRQLDAVLLTDDVKFVPQGRAKPPFGYLKAFDYPWTFPIWEWRGRGSSFASRPRPKLVGRDFTMWTGIDPDPKWWGKQDLNKLTLYDVLFQFAPPADIRDKFHKQFAGRKDLPILSWPGYAPGFHLGPSPDLSPGTPLRIWLERTKTPFYILTNYTSGNYNDKTGPATFQALTGSLAAQFLGYIHGEAVGTVDVGMTEQPLGKTRREHVDALARDLLKRQAQSWSKIYKTSVPEHHRAKSIPCLSAESTALAHLFHEMGSQVVGYEEDATNVHVPMRIAFQRGAARQYGHAWINYASGNFGDACNYFSQKPVVERGAPAWFHSKYAITDGVSAAWYRKMYYLNYLGGASAIYWEQSLANQWILPGPGTHPIQLSPFGRGTEDFQAFVRRLPDRGEPLTPVALLLSYGNGYDRVNYRCKMLNVFQEDKNDLELRELFNVCWYPSGVLEGKPAAPDVQSMPAGAYGNIFDVLVDRPTQAKAILDYPVVWAAGDVDLPAIKPVLEEYLRRGGTLVVNEAAARGLPAGWLGLKFTGKTTVAEEWSLDQEKPRATTPYEVAGVELIAANVQVMAWAAPRVPLVTRQNVGAGTVIVTLVPHLIGQDERAHPCVPLVMNAVTAGILPVEVRRADGQRPAGEVMYQVNRTKDGFLVTLVNTLGIDKTQNGLARVDRQQFVDIVLSMRGGMRAAKEWTGPRELEPEMGPRGSQVRVRVHPGDVQVVQLTR
jgi:hypothetical protein